MTQPAPSLTPLQTALASLPSPCSPANSWITAYSTPAAAWAGCQFGDWLLWFSFAQAPNLAERQRVAGCLATMLTPYVVVGNFPDPAVLTSTQTLLAAIVSFSTGAITDKQLMQASLAAIFPTYMPPPAPAKTSAQALEQNIVSAVITLAKCCALRSAATASQLAIQLGTNLCSVLMQMGGLADMPTANAALATAIRAALPFQNFVPVSS